ncbi:unnamed protein product [Ectocarpus sp. 12 AP-2014]
MKHRQRRPPSLSKAAVRTNRNLSLFLLIIIARIIPEIHTENRHCCYHSATTTKLWPPCGCTPTTLAVTHMAHECSAEWIHCLMPRVRISRCICAACHERGACGLLG